MGEIADLMINGDICQGCGAELGDGDGYPRQCKACERESPLSKKPIPQRNTRKTKCGICNRSVTLIGLADHKRDAHKVIEQYGPIWLIVDVNENVCEAYSAECMADDALQEWPDDVPQGAPYRKIRVACCQDREGVK